MNNHPRRVSNSACRSSHDCSVHGPVQQTLRGTMMLAALGYALAGCNSAAAADGAWKDATEEMYDAGLHRMERRTYRVWDFHPELHLEFHWERPDRTAGPPGIINGSGTLTWRNGGADEYDTTATYSEYKGNMKDGRPDGTGSLRMRSGTSYVGDWHAGLMNGRGVLKLDNGDDYNGEFADGQMQGQGRYAGADGTVYVGEFKNGRRDGAGILTLADGRSYRTVWRGGTEVERTAVLAGAAGPASPVEPARRDVTFRLTVDRKQNEDFRLHDYGITYFVYDAQNAPGKMQIDLASKELEGQWKGSATLTGYEGLLIDEVDQFAPVYLLADVTNSGARTTRVAAAYLDVSESRSDLQPYLYFTRTAPICTETEYDPQVMFKNLGWGSLRNAALRYSLVPKNDGNRNVSNPSDNNPDFTVPLGDVDASVAVSVDDGVRQSGVDIGKIANLNASCPTFAELPACLQRIEGTGVLGKLAGHLTIADKAVYAKVDGRVDYEWSDADGDSHARSSPISYKVPLFVFKVLERDVAECGGPSAVDHGGRTLELALDRRGYRIPVDWHAELAPRANARVGISLVAPKSSSHVFRLVIELSDGTKQSSREVDLSYFRPRFGSSSP
jgi:hypothetical protein